MTGLDRVHQLCAHAPDAGHLVEAGIEAEDVGYTVTLHERDVNRVACRKTGQSVQQFPRALDIAPLDVEDLVHDAERRVEIALYSPSDLSLQSR